MYEVVLILPGKTPGFTGKHYDCDYHEVTRKIIISQFPDKCNEIFLIGQRTAKLTFH